MLSYADIDTSPSRSDLLKFGATVLIGGAITAGLLYFVADAPVAALVVVSIGAVLAVLSLFPPAGRLAYIAWMGLGVSMGKVTSPIILAALFLTMFVPIGLLLRLIRRDPLQRTLDKAAPSYWEDYAQPADNRRYFRQS